MSNKNHAFWHGFDFQLRKAITRATKVRFEQVHQQIEAQDMPRRSRGVSARFKICVDIYIYCLYIFYILLRYF